MELNSKKLESTSRFIYYSISTILCVFLILLSNKIIDDLDTVTKRPEAVSFENKTSLQALYKQNSLLYAEAQTLNSKKATIEKTIAIAKSNRENEKQSFDNWLQTRKTLGSADKDKEVVDRAKKLDEFYKIEQSWSIQLSNIQTQNEGLLKKKEGVEALINKEMTLAKTKFEETLKWYDLKVFLIRLLFVAPILALGIFFFLRKRKDKFWPLYFGFSLFSLYAFFFGLVPYLPSYGGYVRYIVGIALSGGLGYYAIKTIRIYIEQKQAELKISTEERSQNVHSETAEKALENHFCPSCGKDFIIKKWEFPLSKTAESDAYKMVTTFCRHCGLELFKKCTNCGNNNFAHLPYCSCCGTKQSTKK
jgi:hypothetical protein